MSANIMWRPLGKGKDISVNTPSAFITALDLPRTFTERDYEFLNGVRRGNPAWEDAIHEIMEALAKHHEIEVFAEY